MYSYNILHFLPLAAPALALPGQSLVEKRVVTPDNTCGNVANGNNHGYTCNPNDAYGGPCCSSSGYCGTTADYCGTGCQSAFGTCGNPASPKPVKSGCTWNVADTGSFTHSQTFDFSTNNFPTSGLAKGTDAIGAGKAPYSQQYTTANINLAGGALQLKVPGGQNTSPITGAEVYTTDTDILYASVRTWIQISPVAGTCHGSFFYKNDNQETDIEFLTYDLAAGAHYTNQNTVVGSTAGSTTTTKPLPSDATTAFHEYRVDWVPGRTIFYLDGVLQATLTQNVPSVAGTWLWNNWSNGDPGWSYGPPTADNIMRISRIEMYYNRTSSLGTC